MKPVFIFGALSILGFAQCPGKLFDNIDQAIPLIDTIVVRRLYLGSLDLDMTYSGTGSLDSLFIPVLKLPVKTSEAGQAAAGVLSLDAGKKKAVVEEISLGHLSISKAMKDTVFEDIRIHHAQVGKAILQFQDKKGKVEKAYEFSKPGYVIRIDTIFVRRAVLKDVNGFDEWQQFGKDQLAEKYQSARSTYERARMEVDRRKKQSPDNVAWNLVPVLDGIHFNLGLVDSFLRDITSNVTLPELKAKALLLDDIMASLQSIIEDPLRDKELTIDCDVFFEPGEFLIYPGADLGRLRKFAADMDEYLVQMLAQHPASEVGLIVRVVGYADGNPLKPNTKKKVCRALGRNEPVGAEDYVRRELNKMLSELRITNVWEAILNNMGHDLSSAGIDFRDNFEPKGEEIPPGLLNPKIDDPLRRKVVVSASIYKRLKEAD